MILFQLCKEAGLFRITSFSSVLSLGKLRADVSSFGPSALVEKSVNSGLSSPSCLAIDNDLAILLC